MNFKLIMLPQPILVGRELSKEEAQTTPHFQDFDKRYFEILANIECSPYLDLSLIAQRIGWVDVERLAVSAFQKRFNREPIIMGSAEADSSWLNTWVDGFNAAKSLNEKKFSEEDMRKSFNTGRVYQQGEVDEWYGGKENTHTSFEDFIESISKPKEYNVVVEMEYDSEDHPELVGNPKETWSYPKITNNTIKVTKILNN